MRSYWACVGGGTDARGTEIGGRGGEGRVEAGTEAGDRISQFQPEVSL